MKNILTTLILFATFSSLKAQDIIIKNDKTEIKAKIEELTETTIKYKKFEMLDGPIYNINKKDVFMIMYKNGTKEYVESSVPTQPATVQNNSPVSATTLQSGVQATNVASGHEQLVRIRKGYYSYQGVNLKKHKQYKELYSKYGYNDLVSKYETGQTVIYGAFLGVIGMAVGGSRGSLLWTVAGGGVAITCSIISSNMRDQASLEFNKRAAKKTAFNSTIQITPIFSSSRNGNAVGVNIRF